MVSMINIPEVEHSAGHTGHLPGGDELVRDRGEAVSSHPHHVIIQSWQCRIKLLSNTNVIIMRLSTCCSSLVSRQVEVDMVSQVHRRGLGHHGFKSDDVMCNKFYYLTDPSPDAQPTLAAETVGHIVHHVPRVTLVTVQAQVGEGHLDIHMYQYEVKLTQVLLHSFCLRK